MDIETPSLRDDILPRLEKLYGVKGQPEVAKKLGIAYPTFNGWVNRNAIPWMHLYRESKRFGVSFASLLGEEAESEELGFFREERSNYETISKPILSNELLTSALNIESNNLKTLVVKDNSMSPTLNSGDIVLIELLSTIEKEGIYLYENDGRELIKRIQFVPGNKLQISSDNAMHSSFKADINDINVIGFLRCKLFADVN